MNIETVHKMIEEALLVKARQNFERHGALLPVFFIIGDDDSINIIGTDMGDKDGIAKLVRDKCAELSATAIILIHEAWMRVSKANLDEGLAKRGIYKVDGVTYMGGLEHVPGRIEVIHVTLESKEMSGMSIWIAEIKRDGDKVTLLPFEKKEDGRKSTMKHEGRLVRFLPQHDLGKV